MSILLIAVVRLFSAHNSIVDHGEQVKHYFISGLVLVLAAMDVFMMRLFYRTSTKFISLLYPEEEDSRPRRMLKAFIYVILIFMIARFVVVIEICFWATVDGYNMSDAAFVEFIKTYYFQSEIRWFWEALFVMSNTVPTLYGFVMLCVLYIFGANEAIL